MLTACAAASAQDAVRVASASSSKPAKSSAVRTPRVKSVTADERGVDEVDQLLERIEVATVYRQVYEQYTLTFRIYEVKHNVPIDDALFRDPNGK
jgi:tryptophan 2,3-dioxygenase